MFKYLSSSDDLKWAKKGQKFDFAYKDLFQLAYRRFARASIGLTLKLFELFVFMASSSIVLSFAYCF